MTQEEKQVLLKDLCARLPYGVKCFCKWSKEVPNGTVGCIQELSTFLLDELEIMDNPEYDCQVSEIKPYLRPMSSMTEEELFNYKHLDLLNYSNDGFEMPNFHSIDWLLSHRFDYRGLIEKELALEAPEGMYKTE